MQATPIQYLKSQNITEPTQENFPHCYNYGCDIVVNVAFFKEDWKRIDTNFIPRAKNAEEERKIISKTIGLFEEIVGAKTGTKADKYGTFKNMGLFNHDCIDESTNTTIYLAILQKRKLLSFHSVSSPDTRLPIIHGGRWPHRTAVIHEKKSLTAYAIDSWFHDNGFPAEVVLLSNWKKGWKVEENFERDSDSI